MNLYEINGELLALLNSDDSYLTNIETGEIIGITEVIEQISMARDDKHEGIALFIKDLEADAEKIKAEEKILKERREAKEKKAERLREYLSCSMKLFGDTKIETERCLVSFRKSEQINILDENIIPDIYKTKVETFKINKNDLKVAIKQGQKIEGAELVEKQNLQIK